MRWLSAWLTAFSCAVLLAGCGGGGGATLPGDYVRGAAAQADRIGRLVDENRTCAASSLAVRLQARTIDAINGRRIPAPLQEEVLGRVNLLVASIPCGAMEPRGDDPAELARALAGWLRDHASS